MDNPVSWLEILSIVSSLVSLIIGGLAIWLAVKFYEMSTKSSEKLEKASNDISSTTKRLENLFDKLYADTFAMVKDTVSDMRKHVWKADEIEKDIPKDKLDELKAELLNELSLSFSNGNQKQEITELKNKVSELLEKAVDKSANISTDSFEKKVLECLKEMGEYGRKVNYPDVASYLEKDEKSVVLALFSLKKKKLIEWKKAHGGGGLGPIDNIFVTALGNNS